METKIILVKEFLNSLGYVMVDNTLHTAPMPASDNHYYDIVDVTTGDVYIYAFVEFDNGGIRAVDEASFQAYQKNFEVTMEIQ